MGYFNLAQIKAAYPASAAATTMEERAKDQLKHELDQANAALAEMQKANKPKDEIEKKAAEYRIQIGAAQQALGQLLSANAMEANRAIGQAALSVAKDKGLDVVIDANGIYAGGEKFASNGEDVTDLVLKKLVPAAK
jgi:Skp family chaperone for outer membrane proteins